MASLPNFSMMSAQFGSWDGGSKLGTFKRHSPFIIAVAGGTASGKTTVCVASQLAHLFFRLSPEKDLSQMRAHNLCAEGSARRHHFPGGVVPFALHFSHTSFPPKKKGFLLPTSYGCGEGECCRV